jgi:hypothetical protein
MVFRLRICISRGRRFGVASIDSLGLWKGFVIGIQSRNATLVDFIVKHGDGSIPDADQEWVSAALALHVFFPSQIGDVWYQVLDLLDPAKAKFDEAVECATRKHNKYFLAMLRKYISSRSSQSYFTADMIPTDESLFVPKGEWIIV